MYMFFWFFKQLYYCLRRIFKSGIILLLIFFIAFLFIFIKPSFAANAPADYDVEKELQDSQRGFQDDFALHCLFHYYNNTDTWNNVLEPILRSYYRGAHIYISNTFTSTTSTYYLYFHFERQSLTKANYTSQLYGEVFNIDYANYGQATQVTYTFNKYTGVGTSTTTTLSSFSNYRCLMLVKSDLLLDLINYVYDGGSDTTLLNSINNYVSSISSTDSQILSNLQSVVSILQSISNNPNYSTQINSIANGVTTILQDNQEIISQNNDMITQQENINTNLENLNDTITNDTVDNSSVYLPSDNSNDITANGLNGIFTSIYNAFCTGTAQDIVFPIPFTNKNITLQANYVRSMLTNSNSTWVITIIEAFWWYLISRFIIKDITNKITKIKSGNIEDIEETNIKGDML